MLFFSLGTTKLGSTFNLTPMPSHSSQAPYGLLKEKSLGSISSIVNPLSGQENLVENSIFSTFLNFLGNVSFSYSTTSKPFDKLIEVSILSASLFPKDEFKTIRSTNIEMSCLIFLFNSGTLSISYKLSSILIFLKPLFYNLKYLFYIHLYDLLRPVHKDK